MKRVNVRLWLFLMAVVFVFLWLSSTGLTYAGDGGVGDESLWPGEGGGKSYCTIEGFVKDMNWEAVPGIRVYLYTGMWPIEAVTDSRGYFKFEGGIYPDSTYYIAVNGRECDLGQYCLDPRYGQWYGMVRTDNDGYAFKYIHIERSAIVNVPAAALFSNTKYATIYYGTTQTSSFSHTMSFTVANQGISTGYETTKTAEYAFGGQPLTKWYVAKWHYAATFWNDFTSSWMGERGIRSTGIAGSEETWDWGTLPTEEYIDPNSLTSGYVDFPIASGTFKEGKYIETGSYTWSASIGVSFAISYSAFGVTISLDTAVTSTGTTTNWVSYIIDRRGDPDNKKGGMEIHIWDTSGAG